MCLTTRMERPLIADEDIVCYKVVRKKKKLFGNYCTVIKGDEIERNVIKGKKPFIATGDVDIKRRLSVMWSDNIHVKSYMVQVPMNVNSRTYGDWVNKRGGSSDKFICVSENGYSVGAGFIHTYANPNHHGIAYYGKDIVVFECVIPKGMEYYVGELESNGEYASREIRFIKKIT